MKVTVCELPNEPSALENSWIDLCDHTAEQESELILLPEMPFYRWLASTPNVNTEQWKAAIQAHEEWISKLEALAPATVISTRPIINKGIRQNVGFVWDQNSGLIDVHTKYYLPDEILARIVDISSGKIRSMRTYGYIDVVPGNSQTHSCNFKMLMENCDAIKG